MDERDHAFESLEIQSEKLIIGLEAAERIHDLRMHEIELQCFSESAPDDDFIAYMEAEEQKDSGNKEGLIKRLWKKVAELFTRIREKFFGPSNKVKDLPANATVKISVKTHKFLNFFKKSWGTIKSMIATCLHPTKHETGNNVLNALCALIDGAVFAGCVYYVGKSIKQGKDMADRDRAVAVHKARSITTKKVVTTEDDWEVTSSEFREFTGLEFNKTRMFLSDVSSFCQANAMKIADKARENGEFETPKNLTKLASAIHKLLGVMNQAAAKNTLGDKTLKIDNLGD